jgi:hypothetical protein
VLIFLDANEKFLQEISGISATEIELIMVPGIEISGITIPVTMPKKLIATVSDVPDLTSIAGNNKETNKPTILEPTLIRAIGADAVIKVGICLKFGLILPPLIK